MRPERRHAPGQPNQVSSSPNGCPSGSDGLVLRQGQLSLLARHPFVYATRCCIPIRGSGSEQDERGRLTVPGFTWTRSLAVLTVGGGLQTFLSRTVLGTTERRLHPLPSPCVGRAPR